MAKIKLFKRHSDEKSVARQKVEAAIKPHISKFNLKSRWDNDVLNVSGKGINGTLKVDGDQITIDMKLGLPASLASTRIEQELRAELERSFA